MKSTMRRGFGSDTDNASMDMNNKNYNNHHDDLNNNNNNNNHSLEVGYPLLLNINWLNIDEAEASPSIDCVVCM